MGAVPPVLESGAVSGGVVATDDVGFEQARQALTLDAGAVSVWTPTGTQRISRASFWSLVHHYGRIVAGEPRIGDFSIIVARTSVDMMALFVALIALGRRVSFFPPNSPRQDAAHYVEQQREAIRRIAPSAILVFEDEAAVSLESSGSQLSRLVVPITRRPGQLAGDEGASEGLASFAAALEKPDQLLFWQHSSGTTGIKKAVGVTSAMLVHQFASYWPSVRELAGDEGVRIASWLPLYHDMGLLATFLLPLLGDSDIAIQDPFDWIDQPELFLRMIEAERSTVCWMPNFAYRHFTRLKPAMPKVDLGSMKAWISCSEPVRHRDALAFEAAYGDQGVAAGSVVGCYAMAETVFAVSQLRPSERRALVVPHGLKLGESVDPSRIHAGSAALPAAAGEQLVMSSGEMLPNIETAVFVEGRMSTRPGIYGEVGLRGPFVFGGYRNMASAESNLRPDGFYMTGDLGACIDGHLFIFGRSKEMIIVNGKNIYAGDVEDHLNRIEGVQPGRVVAFGVENNRTGSEDLIVVAEKRRDAVISSDDLVGRISVALSDAFLVTPFDVRVVDDRWLVKSTSGKVSRQDNRTKYLSESSGGGAS